MLVTLAHVWRQQDSTLQQQPDTGWMDLSAPWTTIFVMGAYVWSRAHCPQVLRQLRPTKTTAFTPNSCPSMTLREGRSGRQKCRYIPQSAATPYPQRKSLHAMPDNRTPVKKQTTQRQRQTGTPTMLRLPATAIEGTKGCSPYTCR